MIIPTTFVILCSAIAIMIAGAIYFFEHKYIQKLKKEEKERDEKENNSGYYDDSFTFRFLPVLAIVFLCFAPVFLILHNSSVKDEIENSKLEEKFANFLENNWGSKYELKTLNSNKELNGEYSSSYFLLSGSSSGSVHSGDYIQFERVYPLTGQTISTSLPRDMIRTKEDPSAVTPYIEYTFKTLNIDSGLIERTTSWNDITLEELMDSPGLIEKEFGLRYVTVYAKEQDLPKIVDLKKL